MAFSQFSMATKSLSGRLDTMLNWAGEPFSSSGEAADATLSSKFASLSPGWRWEDQLGQDATGLQWQRKWWDAAMTTKLYKRISYGGTLGELVEYNERSRNHNMNCDGTQQRYISGMLLLTHCLNCFSRYNYNKQGSKTQMFASNTATDTYFWLKETPPPK